MRWLTLAPTHTQNGRYLRNIHLLAIGVWDLWWGEGSFCGEVARLCVREVVDSTHASLRRGGTLCWWMSDTWCDNAPDVRYGF